MGIYIYNINGVIQRRKGQLRRFSRWFRDVWWRAR